MQQILNNMIYLSFKNIYPIEFKVILKTKTVKQKFKYRKQPAH